MTTSYTSTQHNRILSELRALISTFTLLQHREDILIQLLRVRIQQASYQGIILDFQQQLRLNAQRRDIIQILEALEPYADQAGFRIACCQLEIIKARNAYQISRGGLQ